ncbi:MAG: segregation/condensation protein A [bacterium]
MTDNYFVRTDVFEGPLDLLLWLIQNNNMDIYDIEISKITSQYLEHIEKNIFNPDSSADFLSMASLLLRIKSNLMLPKETEEYQEAVADKQELEKRLSEWKKVKESRDVLLEKFRGRRNFFRRNEPAAVEIDKKSNVTVFDLAEIFSALIIKNLHKAETITGPEIYLEDVLNEVQEQLKMEAPLKYSHLLFKNPTKLYAAVLLFALLDLTSKKIITIKQQRPFADISIASLKNESPAAEPVEYGNERIKENN